MMKVNQSINKLLPFHFLFYDIPIWKFAGMTLVFLFSFSTFLLFNFLIEQVQSFRYPNTSKIFESYDKTESPTANTREKTIIHVSLYVNSLASISDVSMEYSIDAQFTLSWEDKRLKCRDDDCSQPRDIREYLNQIWTPDLRFLHLKKVDFYQEPFPNLRLFLEPEGRVVYSKRLTVTLECRMDVRHYPLDTQRCPLILCSYSLAVKELELVWDESTIGVEIYPDAELTEFELLSPVRTGIRRLHYEGADAKGFFSCVNATFRFKRQNSYHLMYSYMLTTFIVIVSWMSFWLDVTAVPGRVSLGVTTLLTLTTSAGNIRERLPPVAYVTAIDVWVGFCSFFVFTALLEFPLANYISRRPLVATSNKKRLFFVKQNLHVKDSSAGSIHVITSDKSDVPTAIEEARSLDRACRILYPLLFIIFNTIYWPYYISAAKFAENIT